MNYYGSLIVLLLKLNYLSKPYYIYFGFFTDLNCLIGLEDLRFLLWIKILGNVDPEIPERAAHLHGQVGTL